MNKPEITIVGAGMAGLLAANMLSRYSPRIIERQPSLPNNHSAVLRFGSDKVAEVLGIPFKKVSMIKGTLPWLNPVADALAYASKCSGVARSDRSIPTTIERAERWIAPPDLIPRMVVQENLNIDFDRQFPFKDERKITISTVPMPALMKMLGYNETPEFRYVEGANIRAKLFHCDAYASLYVPAPNQLFNRISVTGDEMIIEFAFSNHTSSDRDAFYGALMDDRSMLVEIADSAAQLLGLKTTGAATVHKQQYAKIQPIDNDARKKFLAWATDTHDIFSLGRFATWRPGLLLDDLVHDIRLIERWINNRYDMKATHR